MKDLWLRIGLMGLWLAGSPLLSLAFQTTSRVTTVSTPRTTKLPSSPLLAQPNQNEEDETSSSRRSFLTTALSTPLLTLLASPQPAHAGLIQFPVKTLKNRYHFMRAGLSELEADGIYSTNPLFLTNRENALVTTAAETKRLLESCATIRASANFPTVAYHSLAANGMDTAQIIAEQCKISRDRLLPEFTYLDQRGIGLWDSGSIDTLRPAIVALDYLEAGKEGTGGRPPANIDGTPNETLADQFVRLRQFLSLQESRTSGENILIIFPDGTGPALLSAMIAGIPFNEVHCLDYKPGEVRLDISRESILELYAQKKQDPEYLALLEDGKEKLAALRKQKGEVVSLKDQMRDAEREELDQEFERIKQREREQEERKREEAKQLQLQMEAERKAKADQLRLEREQRDEAARSKRAELAALKAKAASDKQQVVMATSDQDDRGSSLDPTVALGVLGVGALGAAAAVVFSSGNSDAGVEQKSSIPKPVPSPNSNSLRLGTNGTATLAFAPPPTLEGDVTFDMPLPKASYNRARPASAKPERLMGDEDEEDDDSETEVEAELRRLEAAQEALFNTIDNIPTPKIEPILLDQVETVDQEMRRLEAAQQAMNSYFDIDDGASDWLQVLAEIRDTPDEEADRVNGEGRY